MNIKPTSRRTKTKGVVGVACSDLLGHIVVIEKCPVFFNGVRRGTIIEEKKITLRYSKSCAPSQLGRKVRRGDTANQLRASERRGRKHQ
jgi:hypothetical protein